MISSTLFSRAFRRPFSGFRRISMLSPMPFHIADAPSTLFAELKARLDVMEQKLSGKEELLKAKEERLKDKEEQLKASQRDKEEQLKAKEELLKAKEEQLKASQMNTVERLKDKEELMVALKQHFKDTENVYLRNLAQVKYNLDVAKSSMHARGVFEASVEELWAEACFARQAEIAASSAPPLPPELASGTISDKWQQLLKEKGGASPPLILSFQQAAKDNGLSPKNLLRQARKLYDVLSERPHGLPTAGVVALPMGIFSLREFAVAFCVPVVGTGRDLKLYSTVARGEGGALGSLREGEQVWMRSFNAEAPASLKDLQARALVEMVIVKDFYVQKPPHATEEGEGPVDP